jgi:DNA-directed RNA polymerase specialized sigma24 family protein
VSRLIDLVEQAQQSDTEAIHTILKRFEPKIKASLKQTSSKEQEDLYQELKMKAIEVILQFDFKKTCGFWEFAIKQWHADREREYDFNVVDNLNTRFDT